MSEPRRPILMVSPSASTLLGSPSMQWSNFSPCSAAHFSSLGVPLTAMPSSSPVIRNEIEPLAGLPPCAREMIEHRGERASDAALHVDRAAAVKRGAVALAGERRMRPGLLVARRHHVGVAGEHQVGRRRADAGVEVLHHVLARLAEGRDDARRSRRPSARARDISARRLPPASPTGSATGRGRWRGDRRIIQSRSNSLMLVLVRVRSSTRLTITAQ